MPESIRFHLDEHVAHAIAHGLRRRGVDVTTTTDEGLLHAPDIDHVAFGMSEGRVIFTEDDDFLILAAQGITHAGIIYARPRTRTIGQVVAALFLVWQVYDSNELTGRVEYI